MGFRKEPAGRPVRAESVATSVHNDDAVPIGISAAHVDRQVRDHGERRATLGKTSAARPRRHPIPFSLSRRLRRAPDSGQHTLPRVCASFQSRERFAEPFTSLLGSRSG